MARIVRLRQFASTPGQDHFIHDPAWQQGKKSDQNQRQPVKCCGGLSVSLDVARAGIINRQADRNQRPKTEQVDRTVPPPQVDFVNEERRRRHQRHQTQPQASHHAVHAAALAHGQLSGPQPYCGCGTQRMERDWLSG